MFYFPKQLLSPKLWRKIYSHRFQYLWCKLALITKTWAKLDMKFSPWDVPFNIYFALNFKNIEDIFLTISRIIYILISKYFVKWKISNKTSKQIFSKMLVNLKPLSANAKKWSKTLKQLVGWQSTNCLSVFDHFVGLVLKEVTNRIKSYFTHYYWHSLMLKQGLYQLLTICLI